MRKFIVYLLPILFLFFTFSCKSRVVQSNKDEIVEIIFLQINDVYEIAPLEGGKTGGMARVATLQRELLKENPHTYTFLAGDFLNPSVIGTVKLDGTRIRGAHMVDVMNQVGVDYVAFGNHEFDVSESDLQSRLNESSFIWIGGNVWHQTNGKKIPFEKVVDGKKTPISPYEILTIPGKNEDLKIGIISSCITVNRPDFVAFDDVYTIPVSHFQQLKPQTDFVVGLTHLAIDQDEILASKVPNIPLIMGGHEHANISKKVGNTYITKADANAKTAYIHRISYNKRTKKVTINSQLKALDETVPLDPEINQLVKEWETKAYQAFKDQGFDLETPITVLKKPLDGREFMIRNEQTNLGKAITQSMYEAFPNTDVAIVNSGSVRLDDQLVGAITEFDLIRTLPYGGDVLFVEMKGDLLKKVLDTGIKNKDKGGYLQTYGVEKSLKDWAIKGKKIKDTQTYSVAITGFLLLGLEENMEYLTKDNPGVISIQKPSEGDLHRDIRLLLADFLKKQ